MEIYKTIGMMSGTSLDGLDLAYCILIYDKGWSYSIEKAVTIPYTEDWKNTLIDLPKKSADELILYHHNYGSFLGEKLLNFIQELKAPPDLICSHGHTILHQPDKGFTFQLGNGQQIASVTGIPTIADFRTKDVVLGGQGAPLVPIGDSLLFGEYDACLNLGGFSNISFEKQGIRVAYDICPTNMLLNKLCKELSLPYDSEGNIAAEGETDQELLNHLNEIPYYKLAYPKSLGREWFEKEILPLINQSDTSVKNKLRTSIEHIASQISTNLPKEMNKSVFVTGGGAKNLFLVDRIRDLTKSDVVIPDDLLIDYKEALVFSLLGVLKLRNEINCLSSVTGAKTDSCSGNYFEP